MASRKRLDIRPFAKVENIDANRLPWSWILKLNTDPKYFEMRAIEYIAAGDIDKAQQDLALAKWMRLNPKTDENQKT